MQGGGIMYCSKCGAVNNDDAVICANCRNPVAPSPLENPTGQPPVRVFNYLVPAILVTVFCCLPLGIPALIFAAQVNNKIQMGDVQGAIDYSNKAKLWMWLSFGLGLLGNVLYGCFMLITILADCH